MGGVNDLETARLRLGAERRRRMLEALRSEGALDVAGLSERFQVTQETVRRDLTVMERHGLLHRVHGGAVAADAGRSVATLPVRMSLAPNEKLAIAGAALRHLPSSGAVIVDAGTTTGRLAELYMGGAPLTVLTNSLPVATALAGKPGVTVHTVGGRVRAESLAEVDAAALRTLSEVSVDVAFIGASGVSARHGFSTADPAEAAVKRAMIRAAKRVIVLADHSKLGVELFSRFAAISDPDLIITDGGADPSILKEFEALGLAVELAEAVGPDRTHRNWWAQATARRRPSPAVARTVLEPIVTAGAEEE